MEVKADISKLSSSISISILYTDYAFATASFHNIRNYYLITSTNFYFKMRISLTASTNKSGEALMRHVARTGEKRNACRPLVGKAEGKRQITRAGRRR